MGMQYLRIAFRYIPDGKDPQLHQFPLCCPAHIEQVSCRQRPDQFPEVLLRKNSDRIRLLVVGSQFGENLVPGHSYADGDTQFLLDPFADLFSDLQTVTFDRSALCHIQPALIQAKWLLQIGKRRIDLPGVPGKPDILVIVR